MSKLCCIRPSCAALTALALLFCTAAPSAAETAAGSAPAPMRAGMEPGAAPSAPAMPASAMVRGKVLETMDAGTYTYVQVDTGSQKLWAAGPRTAVAVGDTVSFAGGTDMKNFHSKTLDRTFESIAFVAQLVVGDAGAAAQASPPQGAGAAASPPHGAVKPAPDLAKPHGTASGKDETTIEVEGIEKAEGGMTVGEIYDKRAELVGKEVTVRGKVVKFNAGVMGRNWLHLRDGSAGASGSNDLTVTSDGTAKVGDTVLVKGRVAVDRDFGFGYRYDVLVEGASVQVE